MALYWPLESSAGGLRVGLGFPAIGGLWRDFLRFWAPRARGSRPGEPWWCGQSQRRPDQDHSGERGEQALKRGDEVLKVSGKQGSVTTPQNEGSDGVKH